MTTDKKSCYYKIKICLQIPTEYYNEHAQKDILDDYDGSIEHKDGITKIYLNNKWNNHETLLDKNNKGEFMIDLRSAIEIFKILNGEFIQQLFVELVTEQNRTQHLSSSKKMLDGVVER